MHFNQNAFKDKMLLHDYVTYTVECKYKISRI